MLSVQCITICSKGFQHQCVKMFPSKTRADVGMVQCVFEGHGKPPGGKTIGTRWRAGPCKEGDQTVPAKPMQIINIHQLEYVCTIPSSGNILLRLLLLHNHSSYSASPLHAPTGTALQCAHVSALLCSIFSFHHVFPCKLLAIQSTLLCSRI